MSPETHDLTWAELDRLADYTADALSSPEAASVARLVATNPRWAAAYQALREADVAVRADLSVAAAAPTRMPDDVAAQIDAALGRNPPAAATVVSLDAERSKRRRAFIAGIAAAAATIVAVMGGIALNTGLMRSGSPSSAVQADAGREGPSVPAPVASELAGADPGAAAGGARVLASGTDYRLDTLQQLAMQAPPAAPLDTNTEGSPQFAQGKAPDGLARLSTPAGLAECLRVVANAHPGIAVLLDYARFEGLPALMIVLRQGTSSKIVVVGPDCGGSGTDERAVVPVG